MRWSEFGKLAGLMFLHAMGLGAWFVPLASVLDGHGLQSIKPYAFAASATAAFVSPLMFGAMADRHVAPVRVLRWLALATAGATALVALAIARGAHPWVVLGLIQINALCIAPTWSLTSSIVLSRLTNSQRQFGPIRAFGTVGWMVGLWVVSALRADTSALALFVGAGMWGMVVLFSYCLPCVVPPDTGRHITIRERLGFDAFTLFKNRDHRVVFLTAALFSIPLAAFYPYTPTHLRAFGMERTSAWMSLAQVTEVIAMIGLAGILTRFRLKWTLAAGLGFGFVRYGLCALDEKLWVLAGLALHGFAFTLFFINVQIYLDQRVDAAWRARAQALAALMNSGLGNLIGYLGTGWWFQACEREGVVRWPLFWGVLAGMVTIVLGWFLVAYHGRGPRNEGVVAAQ
jgi:nucleoside transporter